MGMATNDVVVQLEAVRFDWAEDRTVLAECDLTLSAGQRIGLVGHNGSGKTTLLSLIVGLLKPTSGTICVLGRPRVTEVEFQEIRGPVGFLFQDADDQLFCTTVAEDVAFGPLNLGKSRDETRQIVKNTLTGLGLEDFEQRITYQLSGGEKRLVALATVLAMEPDVLLLDEPTAGLDEEATDRVVQVLANLPQAMLLVSHDHSFLDRLTDDVRQLRDGRIV